MARFLSVVNTNIVSGQVNGVGNRTPLIAGFSNTSGIPNGQYGVAIGIMTSNKNANTRTLSIELVKSGTTTTGMLLTSVNVPFGSTLEIIEGEKIIMNAGDTLNAFASQPDSLDCTVSYMLNPQDV